MAAGGGGVGCTSGGVYVPYTRMPRESYRRRLRSSLLYLRDVFRALINSLVCWKRQTRSREARLNNTLNKFSAKCFQRRGNILSHQR